jgi:hypothetical protein
MSNGTESYSITSSIHSSCALMAHRTARFSSGDRRKIKEYRERKRSLSSNKHFW